MSQVPQSDPKTMKVASINPVHSLSRWRLSTQALFSAIVIFVVTGALLAYVITSLATTLKNHEEEDHLSGSVLLSSRFDEELNQTFTMMEATAPLLADGLKEKNKELVSNKLEYFANSLGERAEGIAIVSNNGDLILSSPKSPSLPYGTALANEPFFQRLLSTGQRQSSGAMTVTGDSFSLSLAVSLSDYPAALVVVLDSQRTVELYADPTVDNQVFLIDIDGIATLPNWSDSAYQFEKHSAGLKNLLTARSIGSVSCYSCHDGQRQELLMSFSKLKVAPSWVVAVTVPMTRVLAPAHQLERQLILAGGVGIFLAVLLLWLLTSAWASRLKMLSVASGLIAGGDLNEPVPALGKDEIGKLSRDIETMRHSLKAEREYLEDRVATRTRELATSEAHIRRLNTVLKALRDVNQLIIHEKEKQSLLQKACDLLVETRGYSFAWILLLGGNKEFIAVASAGVEGEATKIFEEMARGNYPRCVQQVLNQETAFIVCPDVGAQHQDCALTTYHIDGGSFTGRLECEGEVYGVITVALPSELSLDTEEQGLFLELAGDIAFALDNIEKEQQRKEAEEQIRTSLREKEELLREVHHRVKNNLQIVASLLSLQANEIADEKVLNMFRVTEQRVRSMASIHEMLYHSSDLARIDFGAYVKELTNHLLDAYSIRRGAIVVETTVDEQVSLNLNTAIPCGLIINELVSNSLKYAFPGGRAGKILVSLKRQGDSFLLMVSNNGIAFPEDVDFRNTRSLGMQLVVNLTRQLNGTIDLNRQAGTEWKILFKMLN